MTFIVRYYNAFCQHAVLLTLGYNVDQLNAITK